MKDQAENESAENSVVAVVGLVNVLSTLVDKHKHTPKQHAQDHCFGHKNVSKHHAQILTEHKQNDRVDQIAEEAHVCKVAC